MNRSPMRIALTGSCGQIAYSLIFRIASGALFNFPISLVLYDIKGMEEKLEGIAMELEDCAFPLLAGVKVSTDLHEAFEGVDLALLVGAKPRSKGMERKDLLQENGKIFVDQGRALNEAASRDVRVVVVGNPANTNCLVALRNAPDLSPANFHALMRLDHNRARSLLARKGGVPAEEVSGVVIWGNHSKTQVPDYTQVKIKKSSAEEKINDLTWLQGPFMETVQNRGAAVIEKLGRSSAASAANGVLDEVRALYTPTPQGEWFSSAVYSDGNPYGIEEGLVFGFPCVSTGEGVCRIVPGLQWNPFIEERVRISEKELIDERAFCREEGLI